MERLLSESELIARVLAAVPDARSYLEPHHARLHLTYSLLRESIPKGARSAVDIGASQGMFLPALDSLGLAELHAIDFGQTPRSRPLRLSLGDREIAATHHELDIERDPFPFAAGALDLVVFMEVIEHLASDPMHTLLECNRVLRPGGHALVTTPNACSAESLVRLLRGAHPGHFPPYRTRSDYRHHREYAPNELAELVRCAGFEIVWLRTLPAGRTSVRWLVRLLRLFGKARLRDEQMGELTYVFARKVRAVDPAAMPRNERYPSPVYLLDA